MKKAFFTCIAILVSFSAFSQSMPPVLGVPLATDADYRTAENVVLRVSEYLLAIPVDEANESRLKAGLFLTRWMDGTPDFDLTLGQSAMNKYIEKDVDLMTVYFSCLTSFAIEYKSVKDPKTITLNAVKAFITYINNSNNHVVMTTKLKKLVDADQKGDLKRFLKL